VHTVDTQNKRKMNPRRRLAMVERPGALDELFARLKEMEELLQFPGVRGHLVRATQLALSIARGTPSGRIANLAMRVISEAHAMREAPMGLTPDRAKLNTALWRLRLALQEARSAA
jgi:hypothetical protein